MPLVWFRYKKGLIRKKSIRFIKKFQKDGNPDESYFGPGMYANYLYEPEDLGCRICEVFPDMEEKLQAGHLVTESPRSFEMYKQKGQDRIRLFIRSPQDDIVGFAKTIAANWQDADELALAEDKSGCRFFDFELDRQFNFTSLKSRTPIADKLARAMLSIKDCGIMIQFLFSSNFKWDRTAEAAAQSLSRYLKEAEKTQKSATFAGFDRRLIPQFSTIERQRINQISSTKYHIGKMLEKTYHQRAGLPLITLAIRGMAYGERSHIEGVLQNVNAVLGSLEFDCDSLRCFTYDVGYSTGYAWLKNNAIANSHSIKILEDNAGMWPDMRWGRGRDYVPFLCLTPDELSVMVSLPSDPALPVSYRRKRISGQNQAKDGFRIGTAI